MRINKYLLRLSVALGAWTAITGVALVALAIIVFVPQIVTFLPNNM